MSAACIVAKLKRVERGQGVAVGRHDDHQHVHARAVQTVESIERYQQVLGEVTDREVERRIAAQRALDGDPDGPEAA